MFVYMLSNFIGQVNGLIICLWVCDISLMLCILCKIFSRQHFEVQYFFLVFQESKIWHFRSVKFPQNLIALLV